MSLYLISTVAKKSGLTVDTVRFYEKKGFIQPHFRADNQYRYYAEDTLKRLIFIKRCRALGMSLKEITLLIELEQMPEQDCAVVNQVIDQHLEHINKKINELNNFQQQLTDLRARCQTQNTIHDCEILKQLESVEN